ncbi:UNVERIFIED_CONTAM: hypothetical protein HDU68_001323 [Siphonaria sp. JEL0065]|nr:hypothetical protein HDU68_001323 [Siphonaria sp. JEL0065]
MQNVVTIPLPSLFTPYDPTSEDASHSADPTSGLPQSVQLMLFENVLNTKEVKSKVIAGDLSIPQCVMINPALVADAFQLQTACSRAYINQAQNSMKTKTIFSEILFSLSPSMNIAESMRQFGISDTSSSLFVLFPRGTEVEDVRTVAKIQDAIKGESVPVHYNLTDLSVLKKVYKLNDAADQSSSNLVNLIVGGIATKGYL